MKKPPCFTLGGSIYFFDANYVAVFKLDVLTMITDCYAILFRLQIRPFFGICYINNSALKDVVINICYSYFLCFRVFP